MGMLQKQLMKTYLFADKAFEIDFCCESKYADFETELSEMIGKISVCGFDEIGSASFGVEYFSKPYAHILRSSSNPSSMLFSNDDWSDSVICIGNNGEFSEELMITAVYSALCKFQTLFLHASVIDWQGQGVAFVGPSGIGKTTQAELWHEFEQADIINGDKAFIRISDDDAYIYGSPWKGSSSYCINRRVPLKGIVVLGKSNINSLRRIDLIEAVEKFVPHVFLPHWDENCMEYALATIDRLLNCVPIWLLECRPDKEAVKLTKDSVFGE